MSEKPTSANPLDQFVILAKAAKGAAAVGLVKQVLEAPSVYVFGELLEMPNIQEPQYLQKLYTAEASESICMLERVNTCTLSFEFTLLKLSTGENSRYFTLLNLFAYGTYKDYRERKAEFPDLTPAMLNKLRHLTMVSLATKTKCIPYRTLLEELDIPNLRTLEDLIIEVIYADIIHGKLDQKNQQLEVDYAIGRDIRPEAVPEILSVLQDWCSGCEAVLHGIETQITKANQNKDCNLRQKQKIEQEIVNIKKTLKSTHADDENMVTESVSMASDKPSKKTSKTKGLRGSSGTKLWK